MISWPSIPTRQSKQRTEPVLGRLYTLLQLDCSPQLTVVWYIWDGKDFFFSTSKERAKYKNIKRHPAISLIVDGSVNHTSIMAYGQAEIIEQNVAKLMRPIIEKYVPQARRKEALNGIANDPNRVLVVFHPEKIIP